MQGPESPRPGTCHEIEKCLVHPREASARNEHRTRGCSHSHLRRKRDKEGGDCPRRQSRTFDFPDWRQAHASRLFVARPWSACRARSFPKSVRQCLICGDFGSRSAPSTISPEPGREHSKGALDPSTPSILPFDLQVTHGTGRGGGGRGDGESEHSLPPCFLSRRKRRRVWLPRYGRFIYLDDTPPASFTIDSHDTSCLSLRRCSRSSATI